VVEDNIWNTGIGGAFQTFNAGFVADYGNNIGVQ
jgi:hypothetical protein